MSNGSIDGFEGCIDGYDEASDEGLNDGDNEDDKSQQASQFEDFERRRESKNNPVHQGIRKETMAVDS